jgi:Cytochrome P450
MPPPVKHVPEWVPGAGFKKKAKQWREPTMEMMMAPFMVVKNALVSMSFSGGVTVLKWYYWGGWNGWAFGCGFCLEETIWSRQRRGRRRNYSQCRWYVIYCRNCNGMYQIVRGHVNHYLTSLSDRQSATVLTSFILAMVLYPEIQKKAQKELDAVVGTDRLPTFEDRAQLPYVSALCQEIQRWRPVLPMAIPHVLSSDDIYKGYFLSKGSLVVGNSWYVLRASYQWGSSFSHVTSHVRGILHNEATYGPRPEKFEPERFLEPGVATPTAQYGYGRRQVYSCSLSYGAISRWAANNRMCPGRFLAENTVFIVVAHVLKVYSISPAKDTKGNEIPIAATYSAAGSVM